MKEKSRKNLLAAASGICIGFINGLLGAGGGIIAVPVLRRMGLERKQAHANAVAVMLPISVMSAVLYLMNGYVAVSDALPYIPGGIAGAVAAAMYLAQEKYLREKSHSLSARILPSLQRLDGTMKVSLQTALFSMAVSSILGAIIASQTSIDLPMLIKLSGGAVILAAQAAVFAAAAAKKLGSKKLAICEIALSILALLMLIPIELRTALVK